MEMGFTQVKTSLGRLDHILENAGFVRWAWDYEHATYDFKYEDQATKDVYYLRIQGHIVEGEDMDHDAVLQLEEPHIGKHLFPHGIDYDAVVPTTIKDAANKKLSDVKSKLA